MEGRLLAPVICRRQGSDVLEDMSYSGGEWWGRCEPTCVMVVPNIAT